MEIHNYVFQDDSVKCWKKKRRLFRDPFIGHGKANDSTSGPCLHVSKIPHVWTLGYEIYCSERWVVTDFGGLRRREFMPEHYQVQRKVNALQFLQAFTLSLPDDRACKHWRAATPSSLSISAYMPHLPIAFLLFIWFHALRVPSRVSYRSFVGVDTLDISGIAWKLTIRGIRPI